MSATGNGMSVAARNLHYGRYGSLRPPRPLASFREVCNLRMKGHALPGAVRIREASSLFATPILPVAVAILLQLSV